MYCSKCGNVIPGGNRFCTKCGAAVAESQKVVLPSETHEYTGSTAQFASSSTRGLWVIVLLAIVILVIVIRIVFNISDIDLLNRIQAGDHVSWSEVIEHDDRMNGILGIGIIVSIVTSITFLIWIYRALKTCRHLAQETFNIPRGGQSAGGLFPF